MSLLLLSFLAGALTVLAPCILPLLPVVIGAGEPGVKGISRRSLVVISTLALSIITFTIVLKSTTYLIAIPNAFWSVFSGAVLVVLGVTLVFPIWWGRLPLVSRLSRSSNRTLGQGYKRQSVVGDVMMGLSLGPVFSTCSPTYLYIVATVLPATFVTGLWYLGAFVLGLVVVLLVIAYFGQRFINLLLGRFSTATHIKQGLGMLLILVGVAIMLGIDKTVETKILDGGYGATIELEESLLDRVTPRKRIEQVPVIELLDNNTTMIDTIATTESATATALFANGCFWCVEHDLEQVPGVIEVVSGYAGGGVEFPNYENYHDSGHREVVLVTYDPAVVTYANLVEHIIKHGNPTDAEGSFHDRGLGYAPAIFAETATEEKAAAVVIARVNESGVFKQPLTIPVLPRPMFYAAEEYHQDYANKNPLKYGYFRAGSGRSKFIKDTWGDRANDFEFSDAVEPTTAVAVSANKHFSSDSWVGYQKPESAVLRTLLSDLAYRVTQEEGTERAGTSPLDKNYEVGIYVDVVSGEPLFLSKDKYDSGTGWPSFVKPLNDEVVTLHEDKKLFSTRTEVRSRYADSHLGHVFPDGPSDRGGMRYCMNGVALRFIPQTEMERAGYGYLLGAL